MQMYGQRNRNTKTNEKRCKGKAKRNMFKKMKKESMLKWMMSGMLKNEEKCTSRKKEQYITKSVVPDKIIQRKKKLKE